MEDLDWAQEQNNLPEGRIGDDWWTEKQTIYFIELVEIGHQSEFC